MISVHLQTAALLTSSQGSVFQTNTISWETAHTRARLPSLYIGNVRTDENVFSFYHSSLRMTIEGSFTMLVNKWGILQGPIRLAICRAPVVIKACMALHNFIITHALPNAPP